MKSTLDLLTKLNNAGVWSMVQALAEVVLVYLAVRFVFLPRKRIPRLDVTVYAEVSSDPDSTFKNVLRIKIRNSTSRTIVLGFPYMELRRNAPLLPDVTAVRENSEKKFQLKFPVRVDGPERQGRPLYDLKEVEQILRHGEEVITLLPFSKDQDMRLLQALADRREIGRMTCLVTWLGDDPKSRRWEVRV